MKIALNTTFYNKGIHINFKNFGNAFKAYDMGIFHPFSKNHSFEIINSETNHLVAVKSSLGLRYNFYLLLLRSAFCNANSMSVVDLNTIASEDRKHFILCPVCNIYIDYRDLGRSVWPHA